MNTYPLPGPSSACLAVAPAFEHVLRGNPPLRITSTIQPSELRLEGEVDICSRDLLATVLDKTVRHGRGDLHIELTEVTFIDVAGTRMLMAIAKKLSHDGRHLLLHGTPSGARKVIRLMGWEKTPGLMHCADAAL